jgi:hypothetical protein
MRCAPQRSARTNDTGTATSARLIIVALMKDTLDRIRTAVLSLEDHELEELRRFGDAAFGQSAGLLAALAHAADWGWHQRQGIRFDMLPPASAIDDDELLACLEFVPALSAEFAHAPKVRRLLAEIAAALTAGTRH